jgi:hypothetical protein
MDRRNFIINSSLTTLGLIAATDKIFATGQPVNEKDIKRVHVIFKTHLDIGFTDLAKNVIKIYLDEFIPAALTLTEQFRNNKEKYIWTTGSWLIYEFLEKAPPDLKIRMEQAIESGDIVWHGLPFTTHTELIDSSLYRTGLKLTAILDERFGKKTISAKMTDVPGHTRSIIPLLNEAGIKFLHIGVNPACMPPDVPPIFNWQSPDGSEIIVFYQKDYGFNAKIPGADFAVSINFTGDNHGPHSAAQVKNIYDDLQKQFPNAEIFGSNLNNVATEIYSIRKFFPVITQEIGDTWIHGTGSDPKKVTQLRELMRLRHEWIEKKLISPGDKQDLKFSIPLLMMAEHTWGLDVKTYLKDWDIYSPKDFEAARSKANFQKMEQSWKEKREYSNDAVAGVNPELAAVASKALLQLEPDLPDLSSYKKIQNSEFETKFFEIAVSDNGSLRKLRNKKTDENWSSGGEIGLFAYQTFSSVDYDRFFEQYLTQTPQWAIQDLGKPGLGKANAKSETFTASLKGLYRKSDTTGEWILMELSVSGTDGKLPGGCPGLIYARYFFSSLNPEMEIELSWFKKMAYRLPEAIWFSFIPKISNGRWTIEKMDKIINPQDVIRNGNRKMHGISNRIELTDANLNISIHSLDAHLLAIGERNLLNFDNRLLNNSEGVHFCLCNNVWGTNFVMWFEDNMKFRFKIN